MPILKKMGSSSELQVLQRKLEDRIKDLESQLLQRDEKIEELKSKLDKYQSVVHHPTVPCQGPRKQRAQGISAEPKMPKNLEELEKDTPKSHPKNKGSKDLIRSAIEVDDFLRHLSAANIAEIVDCMYAVEFKKDTVIIKEGDVGSRMYVLEEGRVEVTKEGQRLCTMSPGRVFGELAILYNCTRTASVKAISLCKLWTIERNVFQGIVMKTELLRQKQHVELLKGVSKFKNSSEDIIRKLADAVYEVHYEAGVSVAKQGTKEDALYIVTKGKAKETKKNANGKDDVLLRTLLPGDCFGERCLETREETRNSNLTVVDKEGVDCLKLDKEVYLQVIGQNDAAVKANGAKADVRQLPGMESSLASVQLTDLVIITTIGVGGFGRVELVQIKGEPSKSYALKQMKKSHIVETRQEDHIMNEKNIMAEARSEFIVRLFHTFKDRKYVYMMLEVCLGGELWALLRDKNFFDDSSARFYSSCVIEGISYLHSRGIVYRDLKPENLLLDSNGFVKLVDFGFAKKIGSGHKTWTFCGTPEYVAPEIILNKGHDTSADLWSLGILIFELLTGSPPFCGSDPMKTYNLILKGIATVEFPKKINRNAQNVIKKLCKSDPFDRLGYGSNGFKDLCKHKWFDGFNWETLRNRSMKSPFIPKVKGPSDASNFDSYPADETGSPPDDNTGWDKDF